MGGGNPDIPDGKTVTPINDIEIWQKCAGLNPVYTSLGEVLNDSGYTAALMSDNNAVDYLVRSTEWTSSITVPIMTSDTTPEGTCFADNTSSGHAAYRAFDGINGYQQSECWASTSTNSKVGYIFPNAVEISRVNIQCPANVNTNELNAFKIQYSDDGTEWNDATDILYFVSSQPSTAQNKDYIVNYVGKHRYWAILAISCYGNLSVIRVCEAQFYSVSIPSSQTAMQYIGASDYASTTLLTDSTWREAICSSDYFESILNTNVPIMSSNTAPKGTAFSSSTLNDSSNSGAWAAFNRNISNTWHSAKGIPQYIGYDFTFGNIVNKVSVRSSVLGSSYTNRTESYVIQGFDGTDWVDLSDTITHQFVVSGDAPLLETSFANGIAYSQYRLYVTNSTYQDSTNKYGIFAMIQFYGRRPYSGVQTWLKAANIKKNYYLLSQILSDTATLSTLMANEDAVDYLVTAKGWINDITNNETAMGIIGANNYAANTLLADNSWKVGICTSLYAESVLNIKVPAMTSDTTPSGVCSASSPSSGHAAYKSFDGDTATNWALSYARSGQQTLNAYCGYDFGTAVTALSARLITANYSGTSVTNLVYKIQGSNNNSDWEDLASRTISTLTYGTVYNEIFSATATYRYFRYLIVSVNCGSTSHYPGYMAEIQFYGREDI